MDWIWGGSWFVVVRLVTGTGKDGTAGAAGVSSETVIVMG